MENKYLVCIEYNITDKFHDQILSVLDYAFVSKNIRGGTVRDGIWYFHFHPSLSLQTYINIAILNVYISNTDESNSKD